MRRVVWQCLWLAGGGVIISMCMTAFLSYYLYPGPTPPLPPLLLAAAACAAADVGASTAVWAASTAATPTTLAHSLLHRRVYQMVCNSIKAMCVFLPLTTLLPSL